MSAGASGSMRAARSMIDKRSACRPWSAKRLANQVLASTMFGSRVSAWRNAASAPGRSGGRRASSSISPFATCARARPGFRASARSMASSAFCAVLVWKVQDCQFRKGLGVLRIDGDRLFELFLCEFCVAWHALVEDLTPHQVVLIRLEVRQRLGFGWQPRHDLRDDIGGDCLGNVLLDRKYPLQLPVIGVAPDLDTRIVHELCGDAHAVPVSAHAALQQVAHPEETARFRASRSLALRANDEVLAITCRLGKAASRFRISSEMPSQKYSLSGSLLMLTNGRTAMELCGACAGRVPPAALLPYLGSRDPTRWRTAPAK